MNILIYSPKLHSALLNVTSVAVCRRDLYTSLPFVHPVAPAETRSWHKNCITQTTSWSPCSKTCGRGLSLRISNANEQCELVKESRLCNLRPCEVDITKHIKVTLLSLQQLYDKKWILKKRFPGLISFYSPPPSAGKEMSEHLQRRPALKPHHLRLHQHEAVQAQILRRVHRRALLHPLQVQNHRRGV